MNKPNPYPKGSQWTKWDLHVHTPMSVEQEYGGDTDEIWEKYITDLENLPKEVKVIGVNDYLFIDGYERLLKAKNNQDSDKRRLKNIDLLLPIVELRLDILVGSGETKKINFHVIFPSEDILPLETIKNEFLNRLRIKHEFYEGCVNSIECLEDFGKKYRETLSEEGKIRASNDSDRKLGFSNIEYPLEKGENSILKLLDNKNFKKNGQNLFFTAIGRTEWDSMRWKGSGALKKNIANRKKANFIFVASSNLEKFYDSRNKLNKEIERSDLLHFSDAHDYSEKYYKDLNKQLAKDGTKSKKRKHRGLGQSFTWVKANPTFEGLRQIIFESEFRIKVQEEAPATPLYNINKMILNFPMDTKLVIRKGGGDVEGRHDFCLKGKKEIYFSPNLTCIIGGRGTGKSTLLGLIEKYIKPESKPFFEKEGLQISDREDKSLKISEHITIESNVDSQFIEFISQNEIESFAKNSQALTEALYNRLVKKDERDYKSLLAKTQNDLEEALDNLNGLITKKRELQIKNKELLQKQDDLETHKTKIDYDKSELYKQISNSINKYQKNLTNVEQSKSKYNNLLNKILGILNTEFQKLEFQNKYALSYNELIEQLKGLNQDFQSRNFLSIEQNIKNLKQEIETEKLKMNEYLLSKGITEADSKDISNANAQVAKISQEIFSLKEEISIIKTFINSFDMNYITTRSDLYQTELENQIKPISKGLEDISNTTSYVKPITLKYDFDIKRAKDDLFNEFITHLFRKELPRSLNSKTIKEALFAISEPFEEFNKPDYQKRLIETIKDHKESSNARDALLTVLEDNENFNIYLLLIQKYFLNKYKYKQINVSYDGRSVERTSFGQRCTAALVILLTLGNSPIIIDEPEAHLDSMLISNYLVDIIKAKKQERQIIFATHNANFVVNGDAELIHVLEMDDNNITQITPTTIENMETREKLINLEGGREAFVRRERKY
jgi:exonuclease SbcC